MERFWICDSCGEKIEKVEDGWLEYLTRQDSNGDWSISRGLRLVHYEPASPRKTKGKCQYNQKVENQRDGSIVLDSDTERFFDSNGLTALSAFFEESNLPKDEVDVMKKRIQFDAPLP